MPKSEAIQKIAELVKKYEQVKNTGQINKYSEEDTKKGFIVPFFQALGWNFEDRDEVSSEEHVQTQGFIDYGFYLNGRGKFFLEVKKLSANIHQENYADQAIRYSFNRVVTWAVLTDFETLKIFNAQAVSKYLGDKQYFAINSDDYIKEFDKLWLLSKAAFREDLIDKQAEADGKKLQKVFVTDTLFADLNESRRLLTKSLNQWNPGVSREDLDEGVQKLLDRLVFLRVAEDRKIEEPILRRLIRDWRNRKDKSLTIYQSMTAKFRELDRIYNSNLFAEHPFEKWEEHDDTTEKVIEILYGKPGYYEYDFKAIPADTLGTVYENYLGYQLAQSEKGVEVSKSARKRKEQGIYYTPTYIVDYIANNTLKPVLDKCESWQDLNSIKVLDPACGSGSFLIRALEMIYQKHREFGNTGAEFLIKTQILLSNIYGVDLDEKAVEITQLNLLLNTLDSRMRLPLLDKNIKNGNSLISGTDEELKKYFGENFRDKKPFNWQEEFPEVFNRENPGFDVIIGNPPYIDSEQMTKVMPEDREYISNNFKTAKGNWDIFCAFIERAIELTRHGGYQSFIVPNKLISANYALATRRILSEQGSIISLRDYSKIKVFPISVYPVVYVARRQEPDNTVLLEFVSPSENNLKINGRALQYQAFSNKGDWQVQKSVENSGLMQKISSAKDTSLLDNFGSVLGAATVSEAYQLKDYIKDKQYGSFKVVNSGTIDRYTPLWGLKKMRYLGLSLLNPTVKKSDLEQISKNRYDQANKTKIIIANMTIRLEAMIDEKGEFLPGKSTSIIIPHADPFLLLGIINSRVLNYYFVNKFEANHLQGGAIRVGPPELKKLPIPNKVKNPDAHNGIIKLVKSIITLEQELNRSTENSNKWHSLKSEIEKTDRQIDQLVYKLYNISPDEIQIVEKSD